VNARGPRDEAERARAAEVQKRLETIVSTTSTYITPIIFSLDSRRPLSDLLGRQRRVWFDLDGDGEVELWPWVEPTTGILVWDPEGRGQITSGRQLFGSVTWWLLFRDGYHALDALDDDRDGWLSGPELGGLAVWFDRDGNGASDPGEVVPVATLEIERIAVRAQASEDGCPASPCGLWLSDGRIMPTYDWITSPTAEPTRRERSRDAASRVLRAAGAPEP
jgi:hypothetical protein